MPDYVYSITQNNTTELEYVYDSLGRLESRVLSVPNLNTNYYYTNSDEDYSTSTQIKLITTPTEDFLYNYDAVGNITQMYKDMVLTESYTYDSLDQLLSATVNGKTYSYTYDAGGNILTANEDGTTHTYTYGNTAWKDQLTAYDGQTITYDAIGNPLTYRDGMSFTWQNGRQLASATKNGVTTSYTYNGDGTRNTKTVDNTTTQYYYVNGRLQALTKDIYTAFFLYDVTGRPYAVRLTILPEGHTYPMYVMAYYKYNLQGDVVGLYNTSGQEFVTYTYDPWGKPLTATGISPLLIANPFRYRGYVYDDDTGLYYCNSRYYDPETGRFISTDTTDVLTVSPMAVTDKNLYAYCDNNPIIRIDRGGQVWETVFDVISLGASIVEVCVNPADPWAWAGLAGDVIDLIPFVAGVGEVTRAINTGRKVLDAADDIHDAAKTIEIADGAVDTAKTGWHVGDNITNLTKAGNTPSWSTVRQRYWKNEAYYHPELYPNDLNRLKRGLAPIGADGFSMELHHPLGRNGHNFFIFEPLPQTQHRWIHYGG